MGEAKGSKLTLHEKSVSIFRQYALEYGKFLWDNERMFGRI